MRPRANARRYKLAEAQAVRPRPGSPDSQHELVPAPRKRAAGPQAQDVRASLQRRTRLRDRAAAALQLERSACGAIHSEREDDERSRGGADADRGDNRGGGRRRASRRRRGRRGRRRGRRCRRRRWRWWRWWRRLGRWRRQRRWRWRWRRARNREIPEHRQGVCLALVVVAAVGECARPGDRRPSFGHRRPLVDARAGQVEVVELRQVGDLDVVRGRLDRADRVRILVREADRVGGADRADQPLVDGLAGKCAEDTNDQCCEQDTHPP